MCESVCVCVHETPRDEEQLVYQGDGWGGPILKHPPPPPLGLPAELRVRDQNTHIQTQKNQR